jgi:hypothetical protein
MVRLHKLNDEEVEWIPYHSGIYFFFDETLRPVYVGKAQRLKARLLEHLKNHHYFEIGGWGWLIDIQVIDSVLDSVKYFGVIEVAEDKKETEERRFIRQLKPCFNFETCSIEYLKIQRKMRDMRTRLHDSQLIESVLMKDETDEAYRSIMDKDSAL